MEWMKNAWASRSSIQSIPRIIYINPDGSCSGSGRLSGAWLSKDRRRACRALQVARNCSGTSFPELQSLHVVFPVGPPSLLTLNLAASHSNPWQPRRSCTLKFDLVVRCSISAECVTFQCGAGALGLVQHRIRGSRSLLLSASSFRLSCAWQEINLLTHLCQIPVEGGVGCKCGDVR